MIAIGSLNRFLRLGGGPVPLGVIVSLLLGGLVLILVLRAVVKRVRRRLPRDIKRPACYERLAHYSPGGQCPCGRTHEGVPREYASCCRTSDIAELQKQLESAAWQTWSHQSFAGRRWSRPLQDRIREYPLPKTSLPAWVLSPEQFEFPIDESVQRRWKPFVRGHPTHPRPLNDGSDEGAIL
ncbi:MAG: hypothetical protein KF841_06450 [Phycisphaerae bacterium]|nr:hypothetical protein [Phycisphaerae bacterium]